MRPAVLFKVLVVWVTVLLLAVINAALREQALIPAMGAIGGLITSGIILCACIFLVAFLAAPWYGQLRPLQYWVAGLVWLCLTLIFELGFGRFVQHKEWAELFQAYTFKEGNIWPVVLVATLIAPWLTARVRGLA